MRCFPPTERWYPMPMTCRSRRLDRGRWSGGGFAGTVLGALSLSFIAEIVFFAGSQSYFSQLFQGLVLLVAVLIYSVVETLITRRRAAQMGG